LLGSSAAAWRLDNNSDLGAQLLLGHSIKYVTAVRGRIEELVDICDGVTMFAMFALFEEML
jgi:hypothetical protein